MAKLGVVLKTSSLDFSTYGYMAAAIERLDLDNLRKFLNDYDAEAIYPHIESLFDLALENIDRAIEDNANEDEIYDVFDVINELVSSEKFIGDTPSESLLLPKLLDKLIDVRLSLGLSDGSLKKDILEGVESSIVQLSDFYSNKNEFLTPLLDRETLVQDIDMLREISGKKDGKLKIKDKEYDSFLKSNLFLMDRVEELKSLESREKKGEFNPDARQAVLDDLKERDRTLFDLYKSSPDLLSIALSEKRSDINNLDEKGFSLLHYACLNCEVDLIKDLIKQGAITTLLSVEGKFSPLNMLAMSNNGDKSVEAFNALGIAALDDKLSPLIAMKWGNEKLASALVDTSRSKEEVLYTILRRGVQSDDHDLVKSVLEQIKARGIEFKSNESDLKNPDLLEIAMKGGGDAFSALLQSGLIKGSINSDLLEKAVLSGNQGAVNAMLSLKSKGVIDFDISVKRKVDNGGYVSILDEAYRQKIGIENQNKAYKESAHAAKPDDKKAIDQQIAYNLNKIEGMYNSINMLLEYGVDGKGGDVLDVNTAFRIHKGNSNKKNFLLETYSELSIYRKDLENDKSPESVKSNQSNVDRLKKTVDNLILHPSADLMIPDEDGQNILMLAAQQGDTNVFGTVISRMKTVEDIDKALNAKDNYGNTVVFHAAEFIKEDVFDLLIFNNAKLRGGNGGMIRNNREMTPLMIAAKGANANLVSKMSPSSRDMIDVDDMGNTPLHYLAMGSGGAGVPTILDTFIELGANIDAKNIDGRTPLIRAVLSGNADLARKLIDMGADVNAADKYGNTPLIYSCLLNNKEVIESVLSSTLVDVNKTNYQGISPYLIVAQRDGLEGLTKKVESKMKGSIEKDNLEQKSLEVLKKWESNKYKDLAKVLISRGAEPYISESKSVYDRLISVTSALTFAKFSAEATTLIASSAPGILKLAPNIVKMSGDVLASNVVYNEVNKGVQSAIISWLSDGTELDNRINLEDEIMIGSFRDEGPWFVKYGDSLRNGIQKHLNFKSEGQKPESMGIYNINDLKGRVGFKDSAWLLKAHETLTSKYIALQQKIERQPWYYNVFMPWKRVGLNRAAENVLKAHEVIVNSNNGYFLRSNKGDRSDLTFEKEFGEKGGLIDLVSLSSKSFMDNIVYNIMKSDNKDQKALKANEIINDVLQKRISVSPKTFYLFSKFALERDRFLNSAASRKDDFVKNYNGKADFSLDIDESFVKSLKDSHAAVSGANNKKVKVDDSQAFKSKAYILSSLNYFCQYDNPYELRNDIAGFIGKSAGTLASVYSLSAVDKTYAAAMLNVGVSAVGLLAANPVTAAGIAALYVGSQYKDTLVNTVQWAVSGAYSYVEDAIKWAFSKEEKQVEVRDATIAADISVDTKMVFRGLKDRLPEARSNKMDVYKSCVKEEVLKKDEERSEFVVGLSTGSAIAPTNITTTINSEEVVNKKVRKDVESQKNTEALKRVVDKVTKI